VFEEELSRIDAVVMEFTPGIENPVAVDTIMAALEVIWAGSPDPFVRTKTVSIDGWTKILYSTRAHEKWGTTVLIGFIRSDCRDIRKSIQRTGDHVRISDPV
jgi:hypothetical protein